MCRIFDRIFTSFGLTEARGPLVAGSPLPSCTTSHRETGTTFLASRSSQLEIIDACVCRHRMRELCFDWRIDTFGNGQMGILVHFRQFIERIFSAIFIKSFAPVFLFFFSPGSRRPGYTCVHSISFPSSQWRSFCCCRCAPIDL